MGKLVLLSGKKNSGKSTAAAYLEARFGWSRMSFADQLKIELAANRFDRVKLAITKPPAYRRLMQIWGDARREDDPDYFIAALEERLDQVDADTNVVIDDLRMRNEAIFGRRRGGLLVRITKIPPPLVLETVGDLEAHRLETELDNFTDWDLEIKAEAGDLRTLYEGAELAAGLEPRPWMDYP